MEHTAPDSTAKDVVFISHANPENNYFATWLSSKLQNLGYKVWLDVNDIGGGDFFWQDFQNVIKHESACFLSIISEIYIEKANRHDSGVMNEITTARGVRNIPSFIIPLRLTECNFDDFPVGLIGKQTFDFTSNWADGLTNILEELSIRKIPRGATNEVLNFWYAARKLSTIVKNSPENYYTNWFEVDLPDSIRIYKLNSFSVKSFLTGSSSVELGSGFIASFAQPRFLPEDEANCFIDELPISQFVEHGWTTHNHSVDYKDAARHLVRLMNKIMYHELKVRRMKSYELSGKRKAFYFDENRTKSINLSPIGLVSHRRVISGRHKDHNWKFAVSYRARLQPFPHFVITSHIIFADSEGKFVDSTLQHEQRRALGSGWYNRKWLETLLAVMVKIGGGTRSSIEANERCNPPIIIHLKPKVLTSPVGYQEPENEPRNDD